MSFFQYPECHGQPLLLKRDSLDACNIVALLMSGLFKTANGGPPRITYGTC